MDYKQFPISCVMEVYPHPNNFMEKRDQKAVKDQLYDDEHYFNLKFSFDKAHSVMETNYVKFTQ